MQVGCRFQHHRDGGQTNVSDLGADHLELGLGFRPHAF
jgi:hypothetical protein